MEPSKPLPFSMASILGEPEPAGGQPRRRSKPKPVTHTPAPPPQLGLEPTSSSLPGSAYSSFSDRTMSRTSSGYSIGYDGQRHASPYRAPYAMDAGGVLLGALTVCLEATAVYLFRPQALANGISFTYVEI